MRELVAGRRWRIAVLVVTLATLGGCGDLFGSSSNQATTEDAGATCNRDWQALSDLLAQPQACSTSTSCPTGSFCSDKGVCDWECYSDTDCGAGGKCGCDGRCVGSQDPTTDPTVDPACPRELSLLTDPATRERTCLVDEQCPYGSHCSRDTGRCDYSCLPGDCTAGQECNCDGECAEPGSSPDAVPPVAQILKLSSSVINTAIAQGDLTFEVELVANSQELAEQAPHPVIHIAGTTGVQVNVSPGAVDPPQWQLPSAADAADISDWLYDEEDGAWVARASVLVEVDPTVFDNGSPVYVSVTGRVAHGSQRVELIDAVPPAHDAGEWSGEVSLRVANGEPAVRFPATAWGDASGLVLFQGQRMGSNDTLLIPAVGGTSDPQRWYGDAEPRIASHVHQVSQTIADGRMTGTLEVTLGTDPSTPLVYDYDLTWTGDYSAATCGTCGANEFCAPIGRCVPGPNPAVPGYGVDWQNTSTRAWSWWSTASWMESYWSGIRDVHFAEKLLCLEPPKTSSQIGDIQKINVNLMAYPAGELGDQTPMPPTPISGELLCNGTEPPKWFSTQSDREQTSGDAVTELDTLLTDCLSALDRDVPAVDGDIKTRLSTWFEDNACANVAKLIPAMRWLANGTLAGNHPVSTRSLRLLQRMMSQWSSILSFVGLQSREQYALHRLEETGDLPQGDPDELGNTVDLISSWWDELLDQEQLTPLLNASPDVLRNPDYRQLPGPVAYWTFDQEDMDGNTALDLAGSSHVTLSWFTRIDDSSIYPGYITATIPAGRAALANDMTIAWWAYGYQGSGYNRVVSFGSGSNLLYEVGYSGTGSSYGLYAKHAGTLTVESPTMPAGTHLYAVVRDSASRAYHFYVDGTEVSTKGYGTQAPQATGAVSGVLQTYSSLDDLGIWDVALGPAEIQELYNRRSTGANAFSQPLGALPNSADGEQQLGLPVSMLEGASQYLRTAATWADLEDGQIYLECGEASKPVTEAARRRLGTAMRLAIGSRQIAERLYDRATLAKTCTQSAECTPYGGTCGSYQGEFVCVSGGAPVRVAVPWQDRWDAAQDDLAAALGEVTASRNAIEQCKNPFGVSEDALPLYFGDVVGTNARFFAASDYLTNTWAHPAVARAVSSFETVRQAWQAKQSSEVQQVMSDQDHARRLEQIELQGAQEIALLCGIDDIPLDQVLDAFESGTLTAKTCFLKPGAECHSAGKLRPTCLRGEMGRTFLAARASAVDGQIAKSSFANAQRRFDEQGLYCQEEARINGGLIDEINAYRDDMSNLFKLQAVISAGSSIFSSVLSFSSGNPISGAFGLLSAGSADLSHRIQQAQNSFSARMQVADIERANRACFHEYKMLGIGIDTYALQVDRALIDIYSAGLALRNQEDRVDQLVVETRAAIQREEAREVPTIAHQYWLDERIERFRSDFAWARRVTYLAVMAAEYELQQSLPLRRDVLLARSPYDLDLVLQSIDAERAARSINGRRPAEGSVVLSLRDDILHLGSRESLPAGERAWSPRKRIGEILMSPEYAVYDDQGEYMGQGIPFTLEPQGSLKLRCAERVWRVGATIQGDILDTDAPGAYMVIRKRNTFGSQWCEDHGDGSPLQVGSVRPSAELFAQADSSIDGEANAYSSALLFPWFNIPRSQFYQSGYTEGSSEELAGRGLYGEYVLLFPEYGMLNFTGDPADRFDLSKVEDVLIRLDTVSVDDIQGF